MFFKRSSMPSQQAGPPPSERTGAPDTAEHARKTIGPITLLLPKPDFDGEALVAHLRSIGMERFFAVMAVNPKGIILASAEGNVGALKIGQPLDAQLQREALLRSHWFRGGVPQHLGQLAFCSMETPDDTPARVRMASLMTILARFASMHLGAVAVYNGAVGSLLAVERLEMMAEIGARRELPLLLWTFTVPHSTVDGDVSLSTGGFEPFLGYEIEVWNAPRPLADVKSFLDGVIKYLLANGPIVKSGDTLGWTKDDRAIRAVIGQSRASRNGPTRALRLEWA